MEVTPHIKTEPVWLENTSQTTTEGDVNQMADAVKVENIKIEQEFSELIVPKLEEETSNLKEEGYVIKDVKEEICDEYDNDGSTLNDSADSKQKGTGKRKILKNSPSSDSDEYSPTLRDEQGKVSCSTCGKKLGNSWTLKSHMKVHTGEKPYSCPTCGRCFAQSGVLKRHQRTHTNERPFTCNDCDRTFAQIGSLRSHIKMVHNSGKHYCKICGKTFRVLSAYTQHYKLNHTACGPIICTICGKMASNLVQHMNIHAARRKSNN